MLSVHRYKKLFPLLFKQVSSSDSTAPSLFLEQNQLLRYKDLIFVSFSSLTHVGLSVEPSKIDNEKAYTASYLMNSLNLSPERAASASAKVRFKNSLKPDSVLAMLENHGFSRTQIATVVRKRPGILVTKEKTLLPKLQFFKSIGVSNDLLATIVAQDPTFLARSLEKQIIPNYNFLKGVLLTDERVTSAMKRTSWIFLDDSDKNLAPNIEVLRELKVPESCIRLLLTHYPEAIIIRTDKFQESVSKVLEMGFDPSKSMFVLALHVLSGEANKLTWERCYESYSDWGWTREDIYAAFKKHPNCMLMSQNKISRTMDFLVNNFGMDSRMIAECPGVLLFSLEKRIIPRCSVIKVLSSKGLLKKPIKLRTALSPSEQSFLDKFVFRYVKEVPKLHDFYQGKVSVEEL